MPTFKDWVAGRTVEAGGDIVDADEFYLRDASGDVSKRVTYSALKTALDERYAPVDPVVWFRATDLAISLGAPTESTLFRRPVWELSENNASVGSSLRIPVGWSAVDVDAIVAPIDGDGTTYTLRLDGALDAPGDTISSNISGLASVVVTTDGAGTAGALKSIRLVSGLAVTPGEYLSFHVIRTTGDTSLHLLGVLFTETT